MCRRIVDPNVCRPSLVTSVQWLTAFYSFAGSDTTSTTIRVLMMNIITNYPVQKKLLAECRSTGIPLTEIISNKRAKQLLYLQACIDESLRVFPSAAGLILKDAP